MILIAARRTSFAYRTATIQGIVKFIELHPNQLKFSVDTLKAMLSIDVALFWPALHEAILMQ